MSESRRVSYFYDAEIGNYHYGQGENADDSRRMILLRGVLEIHRRS